MAIYKCLKSKHVLITGGGSGIGEALVREFHEQGAVVSFIDIDEQASQKLIEQLKVRIHYYNVDLTNISQLQEAIKQAVDTCGPVGCLINNAARDSRYEVEEITETIWDDMQNVNIRHVFFASKAVCQSMKQIGGGSIINFTSTSFVKRSPLLTAYGTAKAGIIGLTRILSREFGVYDIRVNAIMPGWVLTQRQKKLWLNEKTKEEIMQTQSLKHFIQPKDVAKLALFLASDESKMISAQTYVIDGGWV